MSGLNKQLWLFFLCFYPGVLFAQQADRPLKLDLGDAVVTGFSGVVAPNPSQPRPANKSIADLTFINPDGASARVMSMGRPGFVWDGRLFPAAKTFDVFAKDVGQVFGVALDDQNPPNIYLASTSAFGLHLVARSRDGQPERRKKGGPGVGWMRGQFGLDLQGGPGGIYKVDGTTGVVSLLANVTLDGVPNPGPGLGNLAYDAAHKQLLVSDLYTGMIHRIGLDGRDLGTPFDHGVAGLTAAGQLSQPFNPRNRPNIASDRFDAENPTTWGYAPPARRVWGLAVHRGRLYYSVAAVPQIWSVGIAQDGSFAPDPRWELDVPAQSAPLPVSDIAFSQAGAMILAQRAMIAGTYDYSTFTRPGDPKVLRFRLKGPGDPSSPGQWNPVPEEYAVGFADNYRNTNGGVALGYGYGADGTFSATACEASLWTTGQNLRNNPALRGQLEPGGPLLVHGLQGSPAELVRNANTPPSTSYFIDYDDNFDDASASGHMGSVRIYAQPCAAPVAAVSSPVANPPSSAISTTSPTGCVGPKCPNVCTPTCVDATPVDLAIGKTGGTTPYNLGADYDFTLQVTNVGAGFGNSGAITVTDTVPANMTFSPIVAPGWACVPSGGPAGTVITCTYAGPAPTAGQVLPPIPIAATATGQGPFPPYTNCAQVGLAPGSGLVDTNSSNNAACVTVCKGPCVGLPPPPPPPPPPSPPNTCQPPLVPGPCAQTGSLIVKKTVTSRTPIPLPASTLFPMTVTCGPPPMTVSFSLTANGSYTVNNIPLGDTCSVVETLPPLPANLCEKGMVPVWLPPPTYTPPSVVISGTVATITVHNSVRCEERPTGRFSVTKIVSPDPRGIGSTLIFPMTVSCTNPTASFPLNVHGNTSTVPTNLPVGSVCAVVETQPPLPAGCTWQAPAYSPASVTIANGLNQETVTNAYTCRGGPICPPPQVPNIDGICACPAPMQPGPVPGTCICPQGSVLVGGACVTPPPVCPAPQVPNIDGICACPAPMQPGAVLGTCICPQGTALVNGKCVAPVRKQPEKQKRRDADCPKGTTKQGRECVPRRQQGPDADDVRRVLPGLGGGSIRGGGGGIGGGGAAGGGGGKR